jgi:HEAT repeat protein
MQHRIAAAALFALLAACSTTSGGPGPEGGWLKPSPALRQQIEDQVERLPWTHGLERVEQIQWFAGVGEPAYPMLLEVCVDPRADVAASAVAALGATGDSRLVEPLNALDWPDSDDPALRFEKARAFLRLGDWSQVGTLIDGLEEESSWARSWCLAALVESTRLDFGYQANAEPAARKEAVGRWREWVASRQREGLVAGGTR